jgi:hypothetical protein
MSSCFRSLQLLVAILPLLVVFTLAQPADVYIPITFSDRGGAEINIVFDGRARLPTEIIMGNGKSRFPTLTVLGDTSISFSRYVDDNQDSEDMIQRIPYRSSLTERFVPHSLMFLGPQSDLMRLKGPLAVIRNYLNEPATTTTSGGDLVLRSTEAAFNSTCVAGRLLSIRNTTNFVILSSVEDSDYILDYWTPFRFYPESNRVAGQYDFYYTWGRPAFSYAVLSLPDATLRRYIGKMIALGALEPSNPLLDDMQLPTISLQNCSSDLVARLPSIRIQFNDVNNFAHVDLGADDFITVDESTQTCRLALIGNDLETVYLNPLRLPAMNMRIDHSGTVQLCDSAAVDHPRTSLQSHPAVVTASIDIGGSVEEISDLHLPMRFKRDDGFNAVKVQVRGAANSMVVANIELIERSKFFIRNSSTEIGIDSPRISRLPSISVVERSWSETVNPSSLAIGPGSSLVREFGAVAVMRSPTQEGMGNLVLRSTNATFVSSCIPGSLITKRQNDRFVTLGFDNYSRSRVRLDITSDMSSNFGRKRIADIPVDMMRAIIQTFAGLGARVEHGVIFAPTFFNCSAELVSRLPPLRIISPVMGGGSEIRLLPSEYVMFTDYVGQCELRLGTLERRSEAGSFRLYPLLIPSLNLRSVANDNSIQLCRAASRPLLESRRATLDIHIPYENRAPPPPAPGIFQRGLVMLNRWRLFGFRSR